MWLHSYGVAENDRNDNDFIANSLLNVQIIFFRSANSLQSYELRILLVFFTHSVYQKQYYRGRPVRWSGEIFSYWYFLRKQQDSKPYSLTLQYKHDENSIIDNHELTLTTEFRSSYCNSQTTFLLTFASRHTILCQPGKSYVAYIQRINSKTIIYYWS